MYACMFVSPTTEFIYINIFTYIQPLCSNTRMYVRIADHCVRTHICVYVNQTIVFGCIYVRVPNE